MRGSKRFQELKARRSYPPMPADGVAMVRISRQALDVVEKYRKRIVNDKGEPTGRLEPIGATITEMLLALDELCAEDRSGQESK